ncbi:MAG: NADH-dependent flavin oxidoreductase [Paludibacter sp.]|nr:NADH-dependent flavin oxidoreductase [Paludibacter sp.]MDD4297883.1 NADH-dependent flavin oxidoreductase [Ruminiclostridium sp.]
MNKKYEPLFEPITLGNGVDVANRFAMAPMLVFASKENGSVGEEDYEYFKLRNDTGGLIITGAAAVSEEGLGMINQLTVYDDDKVPGLKKLADIIKDKGNKAIMQLHNAGREAVGAYQRYGKVFAPSSINFPFLDYVPEELSHVQILSIIDDYGQATRRAVEAGFDGVEVHGANHYLLQQFFSAYSNTRNDDWGGSFEKRMSFPLAVLKKVKEVAFEKAGKDFIVGYRISPEEVHGENIGYTVEDSVRLIDRIIDGGADYLHVSSLDYKAMPCVGGKDEPIAQTVYKSINDRIPMLLAGSILTPDDALEALHYTDIAALGRAVIIDPEFVSKLRERRENKIEFSVAGRFDKLGLSRVLQDFWKMENTPLPPLKGLNY